MRQAKRPRPAPIPLRLRLYGRMLIFSGHGFDICAKRLTNEIHKILKV